MIVSGAQGKSLTINPGKETIELALVDENDKELASTNMDVETVSLLITLLDSGVISAENVNREFKREGIMLQKIKDVGTCFVGNGNRISIAILPADEKRTASILIGFHNGNKHSSIIIKPKRAAYLSKILTKLVISNIE